MDNARVGVGVVYQPTLLFSYFVKKMRQEGKEGEEEEIMTGSTEEEHKKELSSVPFQVWQGKGQ